MLDQAISFLVETEKLKAILRKTSPIGQRRKENSAEHSWSVSLAAMVLIPGVAPHLDTLRVMKMLMIHDIVEIDAGDTFCYGDQSNKAEKEHQASERIFNLLPESIVEEFFDLWNEFDSAETEEAKFCHSIDRLLPLIQNYHNGGGSWKELGITHNQIYQRNKEIANGSPELWKYAEKLIEKAQTEKLIPKT